MVRIALTYGCLLITALYLAGTVIPQPAWAQPVPANDSTGTRVIPSGNQFDINGGQLSRDRTNLFHSFQQFGLSRNQIANFLSNPEIRNILARIVGGDASYINGLLQVTGGNSNLFLMNPSGIVFGSNARLNLSGAFTATTANGIGFGAGWFTAIGANDYANLVGTPSAFAFTMDQPGAIFNAGNLAVGQGQNLNLIAGTIVSTGTLTAPDGQITVTTVPGQNTVRIRQAGNILQLEVKPLAANDGNPNAWSIPILALPDLLTGARKEDVSGVESDRPNQIKRAGTDLSIDKGDVAVRNVTARTATLSAAHNLVLAESQLQTTGDLTLQAQNTVIVRDSVANSFVARTGGDLHIQGNQGIDILALNHSAQTPFQSNGNLTLVNDGTISGDAHFSSRGNFSILTLSGKPGTFVSLHDPIISSSGDVVFGNYTGVALKVEALGSISAGDIRITGPDTTLSGADPDVPILTTTPALILRAGLNTLNNLPNLPQSQGGTDFSTSRNVSSGSITVGNIDTSSPNTNGGSVILSAVGNVRAGNIQSNSGGGNGARFFISTNESLITKGSKRREFIQNNFNPGDTTRSTTDKQEEITLSPDGKKIGSNFVRGRVYLISGRGDGANAGGGGAISISSSLGKVYADDLLSFSNSAFENGGNIQVNAATGIQTNTINSTALGGGSGGNVSLVSTSGDIRSGNIFSLSSFFKETGSGFLGFNSGNGGLISLSAPGGNVNVNNVSSVSFNGKGGSINISTFGNTRAGDISSGTIGGGRGGNITISSASGSIKAGILFTETPTAAGSVDLTSSSAIDIKRIFVSKGSGLFLKANEIQVNEVAADFADLTLNGVSLSVVIPNLFTKVVSPTTPDKVIPDPVQKLEQARQEEFEQYFGLGKSFTRSFIDSKYISYALTQARQKDDNSPGINAAVVYVYFEDDQLKLYLVTAEGSYSIVPTISEGGLIKKIKKDVVINEVISLNREIQNPREKGYENHAKKLYEWIIKPLEKS